MNRFKKVIFNLTLFIRVFCANAIVNNTVIFGYAFVLQLQWNQGDVFFRDGLAGGTKWQAFSR
ncbi:MAG: hypothetical protein WC732_07275 [Candidatus Omnitrophota bacterium]